MSKEMKESFSKSFDAEILERIRRIENTIDVIIKISERIATVSPFEHVDTKLTKEMIVLRSEWEKYRERR